MDIQSTWAERTTQADALLSGISGSLHVIRGQCHTIVRVANRPQELIAALQRIEREVARVAQTIERACGVLDGQPRRDAAEIPVDLCALVREAVDRFDAAAQERGLALRLEHCNGQLTILTDADAASREVDQLVEHAIAHAPQHTEVAVALRDHPDGVLLVLTNACGPGCQRRLIRASWPTPAELRGVA